MTTEPDDRASGNARPRALQAPPADLGTFLFAPVWVEANGMTLTTLSALARLGLDPWDEAGRLARLSKLEAGAELARSLAALPGRSLPDAAKVAKRLVTLLPEGAQPPSPAVRPTLASLENVQRRAVVLAMAAVLTCLALFLVGHLAAASDGRAAAVQSSDVKAGQLR